MNDFLTHERRMEQFPMYKAGFEYCFHHYGSDDYDGKIESLRKLTYNSNEKIIKLGKEISELNKVKKKLSKQIKSYENLYRKFIKIGK